MAGGENARSRPNPYRANADIQNGYARAYLVFKRHDRLANLVCEVPIGRLSPDDYAKQLSPGTRASAAKSARPIHHLSFHASPWCSIPPAMASGSHVCQFPGCNSMTHGNGLPLVYSAGASHLT